MVKLYRQLPSVIMGIRDDYTAYCLNEAVAYIDAKIQKGDKPLFEHHYSSFSSLYKNFN